MQEDYTYKCGHHVWFKVLVLLSVVIIVLVSVVMSLRQQKPEYNFSVSATGKITAIPDIATLSVGVYTEVKATAMEAVKDNTVLMNDIISALEDVGIDKKDIKTLTYNLNPVYDWTEEDGRVLKGYEIRQNVRIKIRDLDNIGRAIQVTAAKGANQIGNINFTIDDTEELKRQAVEIAVGKAKAKAKNLAKVSGIKLGKVVNVYEAQTYLPVARTNKLYLNEADDSANGLPRPDIQAGEQEISVEVTLTYEIK